jgi:very-short-patch-repair endonuclease
MADKMLQSARVQALVERQEGVIARRQLLALGFSSAAILHRLGNGGLHPTAWTGVYAVGRARVSRRGSWMGAVLACGPEAALSHGSAAALWGIGAERPGKVELSVPGGRYRRGAGLRIHRRGSFTEADLTEHDGIPVTTPLRTVVDQAGSLPRSELEGLISAADRKGLIDPEALRLALDALRGWPGVGKLRRTLDRRTFRMTRSELERHFLPIANRAGLPVPVTGVHVNGFEVDFYWPELGLVVETDGLTYHRTPAQQAKDRVRDQTHAAAGLTPLRFTHGQVNFEPSHVIETLAAVARRLSTR